MSRKGFLDLALKGLLWLCGVLGLTALLRYLDFQDEPTRQTEFDLGLAEKYPIGSQTILPEAQAVLMHNTDGFLALSMICPHLGCLVEPHPDDFTCPCHGSHFTQKGAVKVGPASNSLQRLDIEQTSDGRLVLHLN